MARIGEIVLEVKGLQTYFVTRWGVVKAVDEIRLHTVDGNIVTVRLIQELDDE